MGWLDEVGLFTVGGSVLLTGATAPENIFLINFMVYSFASRAPGTIGTAKLRNP